MGVLKAIYPGSFDPMTYGHLDILKRASLVFDYVIMAVVGNPSKSSLLPLTKREELIKLVIQDIPNVKVDTFEGLTVDYAKKNKVKVLIRGLRAISDFEAELGMAQTNKELYPELETIFFMSKAQYSFISSSTVKEIAQLGADVSQFVPNPVNEFLVNHFNLHNK